MISGLAIVFALLIAVAVWGEAWPSRG